MKRLIFLLTLLVAFTGCTSIEDLNVKEENERIAEEAYEDYLNGENYWDAVEENIQLLDENEVYWTPNGKSYHSTKYCVALRNSNSIISGTLQEAFSNGKMDPCSKCVGE